MGHSILAIRYRRCWDVPLFLVTSASCLAFGLRLPTLYFKELVFWKHTFSIMTGIESLYRGKYYFLAVLILFFSVVFPIAKLLMLAVIWCLKLSQETRLKLVKVLGILGKWSMLDVFIVAVMIVISRLSGLMKAEPRPGIYVFAASILLAMLATMRIESVVRRDALWLEGSRRGASSAGPTSV